MITTKVRLHQDCNIECIRIKFKLTASTNVVIQDNHIRQRNRIVSSLEAQYVDNNFSVISADQVISFTYNMLCDLCTTAINIIYVTSQCVTVE